MRGRPVYTLSKKTFFMEKRYSYTRLANNERFMPVPNHPPPHCPPSKVKQFKHLINRQIMAFRSCRMAHDKWCFPNTRLGLNPHSTPGKTQLYLISALIKYTTQNLMPFIDNVKRNKNPLEISKYSKKVKCNFRVLT